jgi:hypothetical protein
VMGVSVETGVAMAAPPISRNPVIADPKIVRVRNIQSLGGCSRNLGGS